MKMARSITFAILMPAALAASGCLKTLHTVPMASQAQASARITPTATTRRMCLLDCPCREGKPGGAFCRRDRGAGRLRVGPKQHSLEQVTYMSSVSGGSLAGVLRDEKTKHVTPVLTRTVNDRYVSDFQRSKMSQRIGAACITLSSLV